MRAHTLTDTLACTQKHTENSNHVISPQLIDDVLFGCID